MALPPDSSENFAREVDENLRRDQMADMAKSYGKWVIAAVVLFLIGVKRQDDPHDNMVGCARSLPPPPRMNRSWRRTL